MSRNVYYSTVAQVIASAGVTLLVLIGGMIIAMPTLVIGALQNSKEVFSINENEASWFASLLYMSQPIGSITSGFAQDSFGSKICMLLVNLPMLIGWLILYYAESIQALYASGIVIGLTLGFTEAPVVTYIGEVAEPRIRGVLSSCVGIFMNIGILTEYFLGATFGWKTMVAATLTLPIITFIIIALIPESPIYSLKKGDFNKAKQSLCWLRGWTTSENIEQELKSFEEYVNNDKCSDMATSSLKPVVIQSDRSEYMKQDSLPLQSLKNFWQPSVQQPLRMIFFYFFCTNSLSLTAIRPFLLEIFNTMHLTVESVWIMVFCGILNVMGGLICMVAIKSLGKRGLTILSMSACIISCYCLAVYFYFEFFAPWTVIFIFGLVYLSTSAGIGPVPWILICEIFPLQGRGIASGVCGAASYAIGFIFIKSYIYLKAWIHISGACLLYGTIGVVGLVYFYINLQETEGKTLQDIQMTFIKSKKDKMKNDL